MREMNIDSLHILETHESVEFRCQSEIVSTFNVHRTSVCTFELKNEKNE